MKKIILITAVTALLYACGGNQRQEGTDNNAQNLMNNEKPHYAADAKGIGKFTHVEVPAGLDEKQAAQGEGVYNLKCSACHKLTADKLVGPGWKGVTTRR